MEAEKRKQAEDQYDVGSRRQKPKKARDDKGDKAAVSEEEVEEFFAIIRRIHVAVRHFKNAGGSGGRILTELGGSRLRTMLESNEEVIEVGPKRDEGVEENVGFDLNLDPYPDCDPS